MRQLVALLLTAAIAGPAFAQQPSAPATRPATTTAGGDTGLWFVPSAEVLPARRWSLTGYRVNTDFEQGFIVAETIAYADFVAAGGEQGAKESGRMRQEGREYVVQDGDVMHFRFNLSRRAS